MNTLLSVKQLKKQFENAVVINHIDLEIEENEFVAIMGRSGSGKSTLLYTMSGMDRPTSGEVFFAGKELSKLTDNEISQVRLNDMGFIFQHSHLLKKLSVLDNIILPGYKLNLKSRDEVEKDALKLMEKTDILNVAHHDIKKISGGQLQRAAICRSLINHPKVLFGDEPTGALNNSTSKEVMDIINNINAEGTTVIIVTHDTKVAARADRVIFLVDGNIHDELTLGKYYEDEKEKSSREKRLLEWLEKHRF